MTFNKEKRNIELHGEAFFEVKPSSLPFVVKAGKAEISVLGTAFNVRESKSLLRVDVALGRVRVEAGSDYAELQKGQAAELDLGSNSLSAVNGDSLSWAWKRGVLLFRNEALSEVVAQLEKHYNVRIEVPAEMANRRYTGKFEPMPVEQALKLINAALGTALKAEPVE